MLKKIFITGLIVFSFVFLFTTNTLASTRCGIKNAAGEKIGLCCEYGCKSPTIVDMDKDCPFTYPCCTFDTDEATTCKPAPAPGSQPPRVAPPAVTKVDMGPITALSAKGEPAQIIGNVIKAILSVAGAFALLMVVYGGMLMLTSAGIGEKIEKGKKTLTWAAIGTVVILSSYVLVGYIITAMGGGAGGGETVDTRCPDQNPGWACETLTCNQGESATDCAKRLGRNCKTGLCPGGVYNICCEPETIPPSP